MNGTISTEENPHPSPKSPMKQGNYKSSVQRELYVLGQAFNDMESPWIRNLQIINRNGQKSGREEKI